MIIEKKRLTCYSLEENLISIVMQISLEPAVILSQSDHKYLYIYIFPNAVGIGNCWRLHSLTWSAFEQVFQSNSQHDFYNNTKKSRSNALVPFEIKGILNYFISRTIMNTSLMTSFMVNHPCNYFYRSIIRCCEPCRVARLWVFQPWGLIWSGKAHKFLFIKASTLVNVIRPLINCVFCSWCCAAFVQSPIGLNQDNTTKHFDLF